MQSWQSGLLNTNERKNEIDNNYKQDNSNNNNNNINNSKNSNNSNSRNNSNNNINNNSNCKSYLDRVSADTISCCQWRPCENMHKLSVKIL